MAILKMFKKNLTNPEMASYSKTSSPTDAIDEIITPTGDTVSVERKRGQNVYEASDEASETIIEWSKDSLLNRRDNGEFSSPMRRGGQQSQEWSPVGFLLSPAETRRYRELSDEEKQRMQDIIEDALRTDPLNPNAKRMIMGGQAHDNSKYVHWHFFVHAHYIDYSVEPPAVSPTVINRRSDKNQTYDQLATALKEEFPWMALAPSLKETEGNVLTADSEDLEGYDPEDNPRNKAIKLVNATTMALENKLEDIRKRKLEIEQEEEQYITALHYASANDELSNKINELESALEAKDEEIAVIQSEKQKALKDAHENEKEAISLNEELKNNEKTLQEYAEKLEEADAKVASLDTLWKEATIDFANMKEAFHNEEEKTSNLEDKIKAQAESEKTLKEQLSKAQADLKEAEEVQEAFIIKAEDDRDRIIKQADIKVAKAEGKNEVLQDSIKDLKSENAATSKELAAVAKELAELKAVLTDPDVGKLLAARNENLKGTAEQKLKQADADANVLARYTQGVDEKLEDKNSNNNDNTSSPNKPK